MNCRLLTSVRCAHKICSSCLEKDSSGSAAHAVLAAAVGPNWFNSGRPTGRQEQPSERSDSSPRNFGINQKWKCPVCKVVALRSEWIDVESEDVDFEQEKLVRRKVYSIYNQSRADFSNTPAYNNYLEKREETVLTLCFCLDDAERRQVQEELNTYELECQQRIVECKQSAMRREHEEIKEIVRREGVFYELVQKNFGPGFHYGPKDKTNLVHHLERQYPDLFVETTSMDIDAKDDNQKTSAGVFIIGGGKHPKPLQAGLVYNKIPRQPVQNKKALFRACGMTTELIGKRLSLELWQGFKCGLDVPTKNGSS